MDNAIRGAGDPQPRSACACPLAFSPHFCLLPPLQLPPALNFGFEQLVSFCTHPVVATATVKLVTLLNPLETRWVRHVMATAVQPAPAAVTPRFLWSRTLADLCEDRVNISDVLLRLFQLCLQFLHLLRSCCVISCCKPYCISWTTFYFIFCHVFLHIVRFTICACIRAHFLSRFPLRIYPPPRSSRLGGGMEPTAPTGGSLLIHSLCLYAYQILIETGATLELLEPKPSRLVLRRFINRRNP